MSEGSPAAALACPLPTGAARRNAIQADLVFLNLLEAYPKSVAQLLLGHAKLSTALANALSNMTVNFARTGPAITLSLVRCCPSAN